MKASFLNENATHPKNGSPTPQKQFLFKDGDIYLPVFSETKWVRRMLWEEPTAVDDSHLL